MVETANAGDLRGLHEDELHDMVSAGGRRDEAQAEIRRRNTEALPGAVALALTWSTPLTPALLTPTLLAQVASAEFRVTGDYDDGPAWDSHAVVVLRDGRRERVDFGRTVVADILVELSEHADGPLWPGDTMTVDLAGQVLLRPMVLVFEAGGERCEEYDLAYEAVESLAKLHEQLDYGYADLAGAPQVFGVDERGSRFPLEVRVEGRCEYSSSDLAYPRVTVTWPDGASVDASYRVDGRA